MIQRSGLAGEQHDLAFTVRCLDPALSQHVEFFFTPDEGGQAARVQRSSTMPDIPTSDEGGRVCGTSCWRATSALALFLLPATHRQCALPDHPPNGTCCRTGARRQLAS